MVITFPWSEMLRRETLTPWRCQAFGQDVLVNKELYICFLYVRPCMRCWDFTHTFQSIFKFSPSTPLTSTQTFKKEGFSVDCIAWILKVQFDVESCAFLGKLTFLCFSYIISKNKIILWCELLCSVLEWQFVLSSCYLFIVILWNWEYWEPVVCKASNGCLWVILRDKYTWIQWQEKLRGGVSGKAGFGFKRRLWEPNEKSKVPVWRGSTAGLSYAENLHRA